MSNNERLTAVAPLRSRQRRCWLAGSVALLLLANAAVPAQQPSFSLKVVRPTDAGPAVHVYDPATLRALGATRLDTHVPWDATIHAWEGVRLKQLLAAHQIAGRSLRVKALNDYVAVIPWADIEQFDPLLAWARDGQAIALRDKGPLLLIYPFTAHPELRREQYTDRSVWHVSEIVVE